MTHWAAATVARAKARDRRREHPLSQPRIIAGAEAQLHESIPESYKRYLVNGLRQTFGLVGVPIRLSMRSGGENPYARKKRR